MLILNVEPGPQYRLGAVRLTSGDSEKTLSFPRGELRRLLALNQGDLFSVNKIRAAIVSITTFYGANGFIDCVPMPITVIDKNAKNIDLSFSINEGRQYRVGKVEIVGISEDLKGKLQLALQPGQIFNRRQVQEFRLRNKARLPPRASERSVEIGRDART